MKTLIALVLLFLAASSSEARAQDHSDTSRAEVAVGYTYLRSNAPPGGCGCFNFNGGSISGAWRLNPKWDVVGEFGGVHAGSVSATNLSPTLTTYLAGPRYRLTKGSRRLVPFANVLLGATHVSNGYFPSGSSSSSSATGFAMAAGGGIDYTLGQHLVLRPVTTEYLLTLLPNGVNGRQNNFRVSTGIVFRFGTR